MARRLPLVAFLTAGAGAIHLAAAVPHFDSSSLYGGLFVAAGWVQLLLAALLLVRPHAAVRWAAVGANLGAITAWAVSRTVGLPLAHPEPVLLSDLLTVGLEGAAASLVLLRARGLRLGLGSRSGSAVMVGVAAIVVTGASAGAISDLAAREHRHGSGGGHGSGAETREPTTSGAEAAHRHPDGSVHVHGWGRPHVHPDRTVHVHTATARPAPGATEEGGHADGHRDGHQHDHGE